MIRNYSDHAANERTFLAWVRSGLAVTAFGLLLARLNLMLDASPNSSGTVTAATSPFVGSLHRYDALAMAALGIVMIVLGAIRFARVTRAIDRPASESGGSGHVEIGFAGAVTFLVAAFCASSLI